MKKFIVLILAGLFFVAPFAIAMENPAVEKMMAKVTKDLDTDTGGSEKVKAFAKEKLIPFCTNKVFIEAVKKHNAKNISLDDIKNIDMAWIEAEDELPIMRELLENPCGKELQRLGKTEGAIAKGFVFDNQGATVGCYSVPNDYWQGDEGKYKQTVKNHSIEIGPIKIDKAENAQLQHLAFPVITEDGNIIGGFLIGIYLEKL